MSEATQAVIEIRDPELDGDVLAREIVQAVAQRRVEGAYDLELASRGPEALRPGKGREPAEAGGLTDYPGFPGLQEAVAELVARGELHEPDFTSDTPVIGPAIVAIRRLWNWMSTKWYVRPILREQSQANVRAAWVISDLMMWHELDVDRIRQLELQVCRLRARLAELEKTEQE
jgi:hypothetical protein